MNLQQLQNTVAEAVRRIPLLAGLPILEEDKGNLVEELNAAVAKMKFAVVVGTATFSSEARSSKQITGTASVEIDVFEQPTLNRAKSNRPTAMCAAQEIARELNIIQCGDGVLVFKSIDNAETIDEETICVPVKFSTLTTL